MLHHSLSIIPWLLDLFNAPPRESLNRRQKVGRILLVTGTIVVLCILSAMVGAVAIFMVQNVSHVLDNIPDFWSIVSIIGGGLFVNALCVYFLFLVKKLDRKLMVDPGEEPARP